MRGAAFITLLLTVSSALSAAPVTYTIDPDHTHPSFEADHLDGLSVWRGMFKTTHGTVTLDREARSGSVDLDIDVASVDFGHEKLNDVAINGSAPPIFEAAKYPNAHYRGTLGHFVGGAPTSVVGELTLHGITRPVNLYIVTFKCLPEHPVLKREVCGADVVGSFNRADFGITVGQRYGFRMGVRLRIQVEAIRAG